MARTTADVATQLESAFRDGPGATPRALGDLYAEKVHLAHVPPLSVDGEVDGARLQASMEAEAGLIDGHVSGRRYEDISVVIEDDVVHIRASTVGTLANGDTVSLPTHMECTVLDGAIVGLTHVMGEEAMAAWMAVFRSAAPTNS